MLDSRFNAGVLYELGTLFGEMKTSEGARKSFQEEAETFRRRVVYLQQFAEKI